MKNLTDKDLSDLIEDIDDLGRKFLQGLALNQLTTAISCFQRVMRIYRNDVPENNKDAVLFNSSWNPQFMQLLLQRCVTERYRQLVQTAPTSVDDFTELRLLIEASRNRAIIDTEVIPALSYPKGWRSWERKHRADFEASLASLVL